MSREQILIYTLQMQIQDSIQQIKYLNQSKSDRSELFLQFRENKIQDSKLNYCIGGHFIKLTKADTYKLLEKEQNTENDFKKKILNEQNLAVQQLSKLNPDLNSIDIDVVKLILDYREIEYDD